MISRIARKMVQRGYDEVNRGDYDALLRRFAPEVVFEFEGETPFGGERRGPEAVREWFERVERDFGRLELQARNVCVSGPPWATTLIVRFEDTYHLRNGQTVRNHGFQFLRFTPLGKIKEDRVLVDLDVVNQALRALEANAPTAS